MEKLRIEKVNNGFVICGNGDHTTNVKSIVFMLDDETISSKNIYNLIDDNHGETLEYDNDYIFFSSLENAKKFIMAIRNLSDKYNKFVVDTRKEEILNIYFNVKQTYKYAKNIIGCNLMFVNENLCPVEHCCDNIIFNINDLMNMSDNEVKYHIMYMFRYEDVYTLIRESDGSRSDSAIESEFVEYIKDEIIEQFK